MFHPDWNLSNSGIGWANSRNPINVYVCISSLSEQVLLSYADKQYFYLFVCGEMNLAHPIPELDKFQIWTYKGTSTRLLET
jgi:hypothetical protein